MYIHTYTHLHIYVFFINELNVFFSSVRKEIESGIISRGFEHKNYLNGNCFLNYSSFLNLIERYITNMNMFIFFHYKAIIFVL